MTSYILLFSLCICSYLAYEHNYLSKEYKEVKLDEYTLLAGYSRKGLITINMKNTPHVLITGLSGQGKSKCLKAMITNLKNADIVLCNAFDDDFSDIKKLYKKLYGESAIKEYIEYLIKNLYVRKKPLYVVIEELGTIKDKKLLADIQELLCIARHYNIFLIGVIQIATKEEIKFKSYFNARITFKQLDDSAYRVVLGTSIDEKLDKQEFALLSDDLYLGRTFII